MSKRTRFLLGIGVIAALVVGWQVAAYAVHDTGMFELDGNATNGAAPGDDWDNVCFDVIGTGTPPGSNCSTTTGTSGATAKSWVAEPNLNSSIFTGGGSKDPQDVSEWAWKDGAGGLPDKDNLLHSFAARYTGTTGPGCPDPCQYDGDDLLFFGSDRFDNSGDAQQGFWFFQNKITQGTTPKGGGTSFNGLHKDGDLLIISDFSNGGTRSTISIYQWLDADPDNLDLLATATNANCAGPHTDFCGIVNPTNGTDAPWAFTDKSGNSDYLQGEFYEGGVNLTALGLGDECFSSVASETRSSTSTTAVLKDFVLGQLQNCQAGMTTTASSTGTVQPGTAVHDTATISVSGGANAPDPTGSAANTPPNPVTFFLCANVSATGDCSTGGTNIGTGNLVGGTLNDGTATATSPEVNTQAAQLASGRYCFRAEWPGDTNYPTPLSFTNNSDECFTVQDTSAITTTQKWIPQDTATVTTGSGSAPDGTVSFQLYSSDNCAASTEIGQPFTDSTATNGVYETNNTTPSTTDTSVSWLATFDPNATGQPNQTAPCESANVTFDNDITTP